MKKSFINYHEKKGNKKYDISEFQTFIVNFCNNTGKKSKVFKKNAVNLIKVGLYCYENNRKELTIYECKCRI